MEEVKVVVIPVYEWEKPRVYAVPREVYEEAKRLRSNGDDDAGARLIAGKGRLVGEVDDAFHRW